MRVDQAAIRTLLRPSWLMLVIGSAVLAGLAALWVGLQQDAGETSTTFVFARRVGYLDRPIPVLDDHLNEIVNSVEFPVVFERIEDRLLLAEGNDYDLTIGLVDNTQSIVKIEVRTERIGDADRIARIVAEEMVTFVLDTQDVSIVTEIGDLDDEIVRLRAEQDRLVALAGDVPPTIARTRLEGELAQLLDADDAPVGNYEAQVREQLRSVTPLAIDYDTNASALRGLERLRAEAIVDRLDIISNQESINDEWYRLITPVEKTSTVPVAIAMAFAAGIPALFVATVLALIYIGRRLHVERRRLQEEAESRSRSRGAPIRV